MKLALSYKDVVLVPNYSEVVSRDRLSTKIKLPLSSPYSNWIFDNPILPSNMACTISFEKAEELAKAGYFYILHRFYEYEDILNWIVKVNNQFLVSISVGVKDKDYEFLEDLADSGAFVHFVTIDVAHGHNLNVKKICKYFHSLPWKIKPVLIVGNVGSIEGAKDLVDWGADIIKVGLSMGYACTTYNTTGVGTPMYSIVKEISEAMNNSVIAKKVPIIADGQIREIGDACKALHAGASLIMVGSLFAACHDSPAPFSDEKKNYKLFYGSASAQNKGEDKYVEGKQTVLFISEDSMIDLMKRFEQGIRSAMSYAGTTDPYKLCKMDLRIRYV
jgi:GMP reductase